jgi:hypothetical protein
LVLIEPYDVFLDDKLAVSDLREYPSCVRRGLQHRLYDASC